MNDDQTRRLAESYNRALDAGMGEVEARRRAVAAVESASPDEKVPWHNIRGLLRSAAQGATFGFGDELIAGVRSLGRETYPEALANERQALEDYRADNPIASFGAELVGGLAGGGAALGATKAGARALAPRLAGRAPGVASAVGRLAGPAGSMSKTKIAGLGAVAGGAAGAGAVESPEVLSGERARAILPGAAFGAAGGAVIGAGASAARNLGRSLAGPTTRAQDLLLDALERGGRSVDDVASEAGRLSGPITVNEAAASPAVLRLTRAAHAKGGEGAEAIERGLRARQAGQQDRIVGALDEMAGGPVPDIEGELATRTAAQRAAARPLYDEAYRAGQVIDDPDVLRLIEDPAFEKAYNKAREVIRIRDDVDLPPLATEGPDGEIIRNPVSLEALDRMKKALDKTIRLRSSSSDSIDLDMAHALRSRLNDVLERVDEQIPEYGAARATWRGDELAKEALEEGAKFDRLAPEAITRRMGEMSEAEREAFQMGALRRLRDRVTEGGGHLDATRRITGSGEEEFWSPAQRARLEAVFPGKVDDLVKVLRSEGRSFGTRATLGNSQTARIQEDVARLDSDMAEAVFQTLEDPKSLPRRIARRVKESSAAGYTDRTVRELADMLTAGIDDPDDFRKLLAALRERAEARASERAATAVGAGSATGG